MYATITTSHEDPFTQTSCLWSWTEQALKNFHQQGNESTADLHRRLTVLPEKCNYNQCCMNKFKDDLFIHTVKYFSVCSWAREYPLHLAYNRLLDKANRHETAMAEYNHNKKSRHDSTAFQPQCLPQKMLSNWFTIIEDVILGPVADVAFTTISQAGTLPPAHNVAISANLTIDSACGTPGHPLDTCAEVQKMAT